MDVRTSVGLLATLSFAAATSLSAQSAAPAGVTPAMIARGDSVYHGSGNCYACHGGKGAGLVGPSLADAEWIHSKGTFEEIVVQINEGVPKEKAKTGIPMPPKGGATISDEDVKAVAAYVYSLSHKPAS